MIVISVTNCPPGLKGDLSKWLSEVNTGVYVGRLSARVRDELWSRICNSIRSGQATMVYSTNNDQGYTFLTHNTTWTAVDYEGITLMKKPLSVDSGEEGNNFVKPGFSKASKYSRAGDHLKSKSSSSYVILDVETTGLDYDSDRVIEVGLLKISGGEIRDRFQCFVKSEKSIPEAVTRLTGITNEMVERGGISEKLAFEEIQEFVGNDLVVGYHVQFDINFIQRMGERTGKSMTINRTRDVLQLVRRKVDDLENFRLESAGAYFSLDVSNMHRALEDCILIYRIYLKLNEI